MRIILLLVASLMISACTSVKYNRSQVLSRENNISLLKNGLDQGIANQLNLLAPNDFEKAQRLFKKALSEAERSKDPNAGNNTAQEGLSLLAKAETSAESARNILSDALSAKKAAEEAHAPELFSSEFESLESKLKHAGKALEEGNKKEAIEKNSYLANEFSALQLKSLKLTVSEQAEKDYNEAVQAGANRLAPITLKNAENELKIAKKILDVEKENYGKAQFHAERAQNLALRARYISDIVAQFKTDNLTNEQIVLWYQDQLSKIHSPMPEQISFAEPNREVVSGFENNLAIHINNLKIAEARALMAEKKLGILSEKLQAGPGRTLLEQATWEENFREISSSFSKGEAEVLKRNNDIIIRAYGFYFPVGQTEVLPKNYELLNKILMAILKFPRSNIEVVGHTDSSGSKSLNMKLSEKRAKNIAEFLIKLGGIDSARVSGVGVGDTQPIASNETKEGRAENRRIEIIIQNP